MAALARSLRGALCAAPAAALLGLVAATPASGQTNPGATYDPAAVVQAICRQYAAAQTGMPVDTMCAQCMYARATECRVSHCRPIPLVIRASYRALRLIMGVPNSNPLMGSRNRDHTRLFHRRFDPLQRRYPCPDQPRGLEDAGAFLQPGADLLDFVP
jgi:hypothetical protein